MELTLNSNSNIDLTKLFSYQLDSFQLESIQSINDDKNVLVTAHTSAGKSTIAEYAIAKAASENVRVFYTSPIKTLSNQKLHDLKKKSERLGLDSSEIGIMTGDNKVNPDAQCVVMTTEILRNMLYKSNHNNIDDLKYVIFDEVHYFNDKDRGHVWEECMILLPKNVILVMLSATLSSAKEFADWVSSIRGKETKLVSTLYRPTPLTHNILLPKSDGMFEIYNSNDKIFNHQNYDYALSEFKKMKKNKKFYNYKSSFTPLVELLKKKNKLPVIMFSFSRKNCERYAQLINISLVDHEEISEIEKTFNVLIHNLLGENKNMHQILLLKKLLLKGIGIHHSGLHHTLKEIVENLFERGLIKVLFATETFAVGVNMPAKTVVFTHLEKYDNNGLRSLFTAEYLQMSGRAGRRGLDKKGTVIYMPLFDMLSKHEMIRLVSGKSQKLVSQFLLEPQFILKTICSEQNCLSVLERSLVNKENHSIIKQNKQKIEELIQSKNNIYLNIKENISENNLDQVKTYIQNEYDLNNPMFSQKKKKKIRKENLKIKNNFCDKDWLKYYDLVNTALKIENEINKLKKYNSDLENVFNQKISTIVNYLTQKNYLKLNEEDNHQSLQPENLTKKGLISSEINEVNELLLTEIIDSKILEKHNQIEILTILSIFTEGKAQEDITINYLRIPDNIKETLFKIQQIYNQLDNETFQNNILFKQNINLQFAEITYQWLTEEIHVDILLQPYEIYIGNFIKNMQKIQNICKEIVEICEIIEMPTLINKLANIASLIVKGPLEFKSLYLS